MRCATPPAARRGALMSFTRVVLDRRDEITPVLDALAYEVGATFDIAGSADAAVESVALGVYWSFWQYSRLEDCASVPAPDAPLEDVLAVPGGPSLAFRRARHG